MSKLLNVHSKRTINRRLAAKPITDKLGLFKNQEATKRSKTSGEVAALKFPCTGFDEQLLYPGTLCKKPDLQNQYGAALVYLYMTINQTSTINSALIPALGCWAPF